MRLAAGDKALLVVDDKTGFAAPLARLLRQTAKSASVDLTIRERDLRAAFPNLPAFSEAREAGFITAKDEAARSVENELSMFAREADLDGRSELAARLKKARAREREKRREGLRQTLKERRAEIVGLYRRRDRIRRARVNRAFAAARWLASPELRRLAFVAAAGAVILAGGGLGAALVAGGVVVHLLPSYERARMLDVLAGNQHVRETAERDTLLSRVYDDIFKTP